MKSISINLKVMTTMEKVALVIEAADLPVNLKQSERTAMCRIPAGFFRLPTRLVPRSICETDESTLQLLPYMTLICDNKVFCYERGGSGGEGRLHGNLSIGIGGHVDHQPAQGQSLIDLLQTEAEREYKEEVGVPMEGFAYFDNLIYDPTNAVGRVHLGLHCIKTCRRGNELILEEGHVNNGRWLTEEQLKSTEIFSRMENWSKVAILNMFG